MQAASVPEGSDLAATAPALGDVTDREPGHWHLKFARIAAKSGHVAVRSTGSKGVTFLNLMNPDREIAVPVDVNRAKHGLYLPRDGRQVAPPAALPGLDAALVLVMNSAYPGKSQLRCAGPVTLRRWSLSS